MIVNETSRNPKKKAKRLNSVRGTQRFTKPSQSLGSANVVINIKDAIPKLQQLSQKYIGVNNPYGFLTDLRNALGIPNSSGASKYGEVQIPQSDGSVMKVSLRITNHNSNAETYITHNANYQFNLSILVRKKFQKNRFKPHNSVVLHEYVYYGKKMENVENPLSQIVNSIIGYLQTGTYNDTTGVAMVNKSPQQTSVQIPAANTGTTENNKTDKNESKNMNRKNTIRLTESELKRIITESVKRVLREGNIINEISSDLAFRASDKAHKDMWQNWNDSEIRTKRGRQSDRFSRYGLEKDHEERISVCPQVPESELKNMPKGTYVIMDGTGRDYYGNFTSRYSGYAGTEEQCQAYVDKYYDKGANWEYLPSIVPVETYLERYRRY